MSSRYVAAVTGKHDIRVSAECDVTVQETVAFTVTITSGTISLRGDEVERRACLKASEIAAERGLENFEIERITWKEVPTGHLR